MNKLAFLFLSVVMAMPVYAFQSQEERSKHYLEILNTYNLDTKTKMLDRLEWSGLSDPLFFDEIEKALLVATSKEYMSSKEIKLSAHLIKALGYSGQERYRDTLLLVKEKTTSTKLAKYLGRAETNLNKFANWHSLIAKQSVKTKGKSAEVIIYLKMLSIKDIQLEKLAARAIFHEHRRDPDLLALAAQRLEAYYLDEALDRDAQDAVAWLCKAIGQSGDVTYSELLNNVATNSPHRKVQKYARKFAI